MTEEIRPDVLRADVKKCTGALKGVILPNYFHARGGVFNTPKFRKEFDQN
jgi:hypothetical protein